MNIDERGERRELYDNDYDQPGSELGFVSGLGHDLWKHLMTDSLDRLYYDINRLYDQGYRLSGAIGRHQSHQEGETVYTATLVMPEKTINPFGPLDLQDVMGEPGTMTPDRHFGRGFAGQDNPQLPT